MISKEERTWAMAAHLSAFAGHFVVLGGFLGPLVVFFLTRDDKPFAAQEAKEALNFHLTMLLAGILSFLLMIVLIGFLLIGIVLLLLVILPIIAAINAYDGKPFRYPLTIRFIA